VCGGVGDGGGVGVGGRGVCVTKSGPGHGDRLSPQSLLLVGVTS